MIPAIDDDDDTELPRTSTIPTLNNGSTLVWIKREQFKSLATPRLINDVMWVWTVQADLRNSALPICNSGAT